MSMNRVSLLVLCLFFAVGINAQTKTIDSLRHKFLTSANSRQRKENTLLMLSQSRSLSPDTTLFYIQQLAKNTPATDTSAILSKQRYLAYYYYRTAKLDTALTIINNTIKIVEADKNNRAQLNELYYLRGGILVKKNEYKAALSQNYNALHYAEQMRDTAFIIRSLNGIGWVYMEMEQPKEALGWLKKSLAVTSNKNYGYLHGMVYANMASCYGYIGQIDSAKMYIMRGYNLAMEADDLFLQANLLALMANVQILSKRYGDAVISVQKAVAIRRVLKDPFYIISDMSSLAYLYAETNKADLGITLMKEAIDIARANDLKAKLPLLYGALAYNYNVKRDYKNQTEALATSLALKDTLYENAKAKDLAEMQAKYETQKKVDEIKILQKENELKDAETRNVTLLSISIIVILLGAGLFTYKFIGIKQKKKLAEEKIKMERQQLQAIIHTQEEERKRISAELHDGIGPVLSAAKLNLSMLGYDEKDALRYETAIALIDKSYKELRTVSHIMMPATLLKKGIVEATQQLADDLNSSGAINIFVDADNPKKRYPEHIEINLYRIVQELLNNIVKHAKPTEVQLQFSEEQDELTLMIEDNGAGYDADSLRNGNGNGWNNITTRLRILNGIIEIDSHKGKKGSVVFILIPIKPQTAA